MPGQKISPQGLRAQEKIEGLILDSLLTDFVENSKQRGLITHGQMSQMFEFMYYLVKPTVNTMLAEPRTHISKVIARFLTPEGAGGSLREIALQMLSDQEAPSLLRLMCQKYIKALLTLKPPTKSDYVSE